MIDTLREWLPRIEATAHDLRLDPGEVEFRVVPAPLLYEVTAYGGLGGYSHWSRGRDYWITKQRLERGAGRIYEVVFPGTPPLAYLLDGNTLAAQILVMAHVLGHTHLFRHHVLGAAADWAQVQAAARHRFAEYERRWGAERVERTLDAALAIRDQCAEDPPLKPDPAPTEPHPYEHLWPSRPWPQPKPPPRYRLPTSDLIGFLARESPVLEDWQRDILLVVRQEGLMRAKMWPIKTIHESFAAWTHREILRRLTLPDQEAVEAMAVHARVVAPDPLALNPYSLYPLLDQLVAEVGTARAIQIWQEETDASLVRTWLTRDRWEACRLYGYRWESGETADVAVRLAYADDDDWAAWRNALADALAVGPPEVRVVDVGPDYQLRLMVPRTVPPLDRDWARLACQAVARLWGAGVRLETPDWTETVAARERI
ncbi:MAG: SpoVR family protein [Actinomycetia bacterium]|nr:SpoVR family protein [Actinomycetes bacterium]